MGYTTAGTIIGGGIGLATGNPWLGATIGAGVGGGLDARVTSYYNANASRVAAQYNYQQTLRTAKFNNQIATAIAGVNNAVTMAGATVASQTTQAIAAYNANITKQVANHNASLLEHEAELVYEAADLDAEQYRRVAEQQQGAAEVFYGASGVKITEPDDTPGQVLLDMEVEEELEVAIIRHQADIQASKLLLGAATSRWEGEVAANQILFEGFSSALTNLVQAQASVIGNTAQTALDNVARSYNARSRANEILYSGNIDAWNYEKEGDRAFMRGLFSAGSAYSTHKALTADKDVAPEPSRPRAGPSPHTDFNRPLLEN